MQTPTIVPLPHDQPSKILNILCFVCPPIALLVYLALVGKLPRQALCAGLWGARGAATGVVLFILGNIGVFIWEGYQSATAPPVATQTEAARPPHP